MPRHAPVKNLPFPFLRFPLGRGRPSALSCGGRTSEHSLRAAVGHTLFRSDSHIPRGVRSQMGARVKVEDPPPLDSPWPGRPFRHAN